MLEPVEWSNDLLVGSRTLDQHHQILAGTVNRLIALQEKWEDCLPAVVRELSYLHSYCAIHFSVEELAMVRGGVPREPLEEHQRTHRAILKKMAQLNERLHADPNRFPFADTIKFLRMWLIRHVAEDDRSTYGDLVGRDPMIENTIRHLSYADLAQKLALKTRTPGPETKTVLVVDSHLEHRTLIGRALRSSGWTDKLARDIHDARPMMNGEKPAAVMVTLTQEWGGELIWRCYAEHGIPAIATYFGHPSDAIIQQAERLGASNMLLMPAAPTAVHETVRQAVQGWAPLRALVQSRLDRGAVAA